VTTPDDTGTHRVRRTGRTPARAGRPSTAGRRLVVTVAVGLLCLVPAAPAAAHVLIETVEPNGDGTATLTFTFDHGCEGEPTDTMDVTMPDGVEALAADQPDGWTADVEPGSVRWEGEPVPDGDRAEFTLDVRVTGTVGRSFSFPTEQECAGDGSYQWTDTDPSGDYPAPTFVATAASLAETTVTPATPAASQSGPPLPIGWLVAGVALVSLVAGAIGSRATRRHHRLTS
jgi:periplasmic copper chaperone A